MTPAKTRTQRMTGAIGCALACVLLAAANGRAQTPLKTVATQNLQVHVQVVAYMGYFMPVIRIGDLTNATRYCNETQMIYTASTQTFACPNVPVGAQVIVRVTQQSSGAYLAACQLTMFSTASPPHIKFTYTFTNHLITGTRLSGVTCTSQGSTRSAQQS